MCAMFRLKQEMCVCRAWKESSCLKFAQELCSSGRLKIGLLTTVAKLPGKDFIMLERSDHMRV